MRPLLVLLLTLSMLVPAALQPVKALVLAGIMALALMAMLRGTLRLPWVPWMLLALAYAAFGAVMSALGAVRGNPGAMAMLTVMVAYPLLLTALIDAARPGDPQRLDRWLLRMAMAIAVLDISFVGWALLNPGNPLATFMESLYGEWAAVDSSSDYTLFTLPNIASIIFLLPYALIRSCLEPRGKAKWLWLATVLLLALPVLLSGRRALYLGSALGLLAGLMAAAMVSTRKPSGPSLGTRVAQTLLPLGMLGTGVFAVGIAAGLINWDLIVTGVEGLFDFQGEQSNIERRLQFDALLEGLAQAPLLGQGAGAAASYIRSDEMPWAYELFYVSLAFHYGLVGFTLYACGIITLMVLFLQQCVRGHESHVMAAWFGALVAFFFATATNPYLLKFDYMWTVFIPMAWVRLAMTRPGARQGSAAARQVTS
jgi:hypothetical protein